ncbi:DUF6301 family protein [Nocardia sp. NPDC052566]|uniref:DUF6301 family protein n=1 Tax=Nocardia sp. NPDC052566 TaxID=3364330 RepID=UPI0037C537B1
MRADLDRAVRVIEAAMEFDWAWTVDDLPGFAERVGWQLGDLDVLSPPLSTNLDVNRTVAAVSAAPKAIYGRPRELTMVSFSASDVVLDDPAVKPVLSDLFDDFAQRVFELVGQEPTRWWLRDPDRTVRWDLSGIVIQLAVSDTSLRVRLISPAEQARDDEWDRRLDPDLNPDLDPIQ